MKIIDSIEKIELYKSHIYKFKIPFNLTLSTRCARFRLKYSAVLSIMN